MSVEAVPSAGWMVLLGLYHGLNPAMGWLFAVALGLQAGAGSAVARALAPMALGHAVAVGAVVLLAVLIGEVLPGAAVRAVVGVVLVGAGVYRFVQPRHPRWVRMQVGPRDLALWSFLVASAHGAGLMVVPFLLASPAASATTATAHHHGHQAHGLAAALAATGLHTAGYLAATGFVAWIVYRWFGLSLLRRAWFNVDLVWASALVVTGVATLLG
jgi:hypothetical protein